jgi:hypothetical protein
VIKLVKPTKDKNDFEESMVLFENRLAVIPYSPLIDRDGLEITGIDNKYERMKEVKRIKTKRNQLALEKVTWRFRMGLWDRRKYIQLAIRFLFVFYPPGKILLGKEVINRKTLQGISLISKLGHYFTNHFFLRESLFRSKKRKIIISDDMSIREKRIATENKKKQSLLLFVYRVIAITNIGLFFYDDNRGGLSYRLLGHIAKDI